MYRLTSTEVRQPQKAPNFAVSWSIGLGEPEIVNTTLGKPEEGISYLTKQNFASRFLHLYRLLSTFGEEKQNFTTYMDAKDKAVDFNVSMIFLE